MKPEDDRYRYRYKKLVVELVVDIKYKNLVVD
jgi:hypothetical protein